MSMDNIQAVQSLQYLSAYDQILNTKAVARDVLKDQGRRLDPASFHRHSQAGEGELLPIRSGVRDSLLDILDELQVKDAGHIERLFTFLQLFPTRQTMYTKTSARVRRRLSKSSTSFIDRSIWRVWTALG
ncbi:hypothetical protein E4U55_005733 [Claviceps digitariae]|nr:hypothetical protein E4U55_005733 [Claviceps digitariae]